MQTTVSGETILWIIGGLLSILLTVIGFIIKYVLKIQDRTRKELMEEQAAVRERLEIVNEQAQAEAAEIKYNYLNRFAVLNKNVTDTKEEVLKSLFEIRLIIEQNKHL